MAEASLALTGNRKNGGGIVETDQVAAARPAPSEAVSQPARISIVSDIKAFLALEDDWRALEALNAPRRAVFQSFDWLKCWAAAHASRREIRFPIIAIGRSDGRLVFAWALMKTRSGPVTLLRWMSDPYSQYGDILLAPGECAKSWMNDALAELKKRRGVDSIRLRHVRDDAAALPFLKEKARDARFIEQAPFLDLESFSGQAAYEGRYTATQRKRRKKIRKSLEDDFGPLEFKLLTTKPDIDRAIDQAIAEKSHWIESRGRQNRVLGSPRMPGFLKSLAASGDDGCRLVVSELRAGGRPVSWEIGLRLGKTHYAFITSHAGHLTDYSPARLHMDFSQRQALADGLAAFDLMIPADPYKDSWSSARSEARDYHIALTRKGWLYGRLYLEVIRPQLRAAYYRMPQGLLKALKLILRH